MTSGGEPYSVYFAAKSGQAEQLQVSKEAFGRNHVVIRGCRAPV